MHIEPSPTHRLTPARELSPSDLAAAYLARTQASLSSLRLRIDESMAVMRRTQGDVLARKSARRCLSPWEHRVFERDAPVAEAVDTQPGPSSIALAASPAPFRESVCARAIDILGAAYELAPAEVCADVQVVATWAQGADDLLVSLCRPHAWPADLGVFYLAAIRQALGLSVGVSPFDP